MYTLEISTKFWFFFFLSFSPFFCLITFSFYSVCPARFKVGLWMQTAQIDIIKTHLAMSQNYLSALCNRSFRHILLSTSHSDDLALMTSDIHSHLLVSGLLVPITPTTPPSLTTLLSMSFLLSLPRGCTANEILLVNGVFWQVFWISLKASYNKDGLLKARGTVSRG